MKSLQKMTLALLSSTILSSASIQAVEGECQLCKKIREDNKLHHKNYDYYEDFLSEEQRNESSCEALTPNVNGKQPMLNKNAK